MVKELLIIGTMPTVPSVVSHSYKPLLKYAKEYNPEAIFVEDISPEDTLSLKNFTPRFLKLADSVSQVNIIDEQRFQILRAKQLSDMDSCDFSFLANAYLQKRDRANHTYYNYLKTYGTAGSKKPQRRENEDLIFPLAVSMGITELLPVDDHQTEPDHLRIVEFQCDEAAERSACGDADIKQGGKTCRRRGIDAFDVDEPGRSP